MTVVSKPKHPRYKPGMIYAVPLEDGAYGLAQAGDAMFPHVIYVALFLDRFETLPTSPTVLDPSHVVSLTATWRKDLNRGNWVPLGPAEQTQGLQKHPYQDLANEGYVGAKHYDAGLLSEYLSAYHGILPWNVMYDPTYFDSLLAPNAHRSAKVRVLGEEERTAYRRKVFGVGA